MKRRGLVLAALITVTAGCVGEPAESSGEQGPSPSASAAVPSVKNLTVAEVCARATDIWTRTDSLELEDLRAVEQALFEISTEPSNADETFALIYLQMALSDAIASTVSDSRGAMRRELDRGFAEFEDACEQDVADLGGASA